MNIGWSVYIFAVILGLLSYLICLFILRKKEEIKLIDYLFSGNNIIMSAFSIISSIFSAAIFFTALVGLYILFGMIILPASIIPALFGLYLLKRKFSNINEFFPDSSTASKTEIAIKRFRYLINSVNKVIPFYIVLLVYLLLMIITEISAFNFIINTFLINDPWAPFIVYIVILSALSYVFISGFRGVLVTDTLQTIVILSLFIFIFSSIPKINISSDLTVYFKLPPKLDTAIIILAGILLCPALFSSVPEIWLRVVTLKKNKDGRRAISFAMFLLPFIAVLPVALIIISGISPIFKGDSSVAFDIWRGIFHGRQNIILIFFLMVLATAFFTTIDTLIITYSQIIYMIKGNNLLERFLPKNERTSSIIFILLGLIISKNLSPILHSVLAVYVGALPIYLFMMIYVYPSLKNKKIIYSITNVSFWLQLFSALPIILVAENIIHKKNISHLAYPLIPIAVAFVELISLLINIVYNFGKRRKKNVKI